MDNSTSALIQNSSTIMSLTKTEEQRQFPVSVRESPQVYLSLRPHGYDDRGQCITEAS